MTGRTLTMALALGLVAGLALPTRPSRAGAGEAAAVDRARAGVHHHSSSRWLGSHPSSGGGGYLRPSARTPAEQRHPRAGTGTGYSGGGYYSYYPGYGYWYGPGYWPSYYYGYWPYYGGAYFGLGVHWRLLRRRVLRRGYYGGGYGDAMLPTIARTPMATRARLRLLVDPEDARVYVDGLLSRARSTTSTACSSA